MNNWIGLTGLFLLLGSPLFAQLETPPASPPATFVQRIGYTDVRIDYSRPGVKGRKIFGELLPYGQIWRSGANEASRIHFSKTVSIGAQSLPAGTYGLYAIPGEKEWTWIFSRDTALWGDRGYNPQRDVLRHSSPVETLSKRVETLEFRWMNLSFQAADLVMEWEYSRVGIPVRFSTDEEVEARIQKVMAGKPKGEDYYRAARYYLDNHRELPQARQWIDRRVQLEGEQFGILRYQALLQHVTGDTASARRTMMRSLELARQAGNAHYVRMNEQSLSAWNRPLAPLSAAEIINRSIAYHDPEGAWSAGRFEFSLLEERPQDKFDRISDLVIDNKTAFFSLFQRRGKDLLLRELGPEGNCRSAVNGSSSLSAEQIRQYRLRCEDHPGYRDYYLYLWGLPMKLRDPGTLPAPEAYVRDFFGKQLYEVKVSYESSVGSDIWYFYFDPATFALSGYRFYHDEAKNDGEYILLSGEARVGPLRLPARREWYLHGSRSYLGADELIPFPANPR